MPDWIAGNVREINTLIMSEYRVSTRAEEQQYKQSYEYYKENRDRNKAYKERYKKESKK